MPFHVMHRDQRSVPSEGQTRRQLRADQQRTRQSGALGVSDCFHVWPRTLGRSQHLIDQAQAVFDVVTASQLRHYAAIRRMQRDLRMQRFGHDFAAFSVK